MKISKPMIIAALVAGNLLAWDLALRAGETNTPPAKPAAGAPPADQRPPRGAGFERLAEQLNLTADQKPKVQALVDAQRQKGQELRQNTSLSQEERQAKRTAMHEEMVTQMKAVLTPEQFEKWQKMPQMMRGPRNGPPPGGEKTGGTNAPAAPPKK
jgi:Spy/CpxP family protein refolding chaperone